MFEYHGWVTIRDATGDGDEHRLQEAADLVRRRLASAGKSIGFVDFRWENGVPMLHVGGLPNHFGRQGQEVIELFKYVATVAPGSYGLLFTYDDEDPDARRTGTFRVLRLARGEVSEHVDPFLSPVVPTIEDNEVPDEQVGR